MAHATMEKEFESMVMKKKPPPPRPPPPYVGSSSSREDRLSQSLGSSSPALQRIPNRPPSLDSSSCDRIRSSTSVSASSDMFSQKKERTKSTNNFLFIKEDLEKCISQKNSTKPSNVGVKPSSGAAQGAADQKRKTSNPKQPPSPTPRTKSPILSSKPSAATKPGSPTKPTSVTSSSSKPAVAKLTSFQPTPAPRSKSPLPPSKPTSPPFTSISPSNTNKTAIKQHLHNSTDSRNISITPPAERKPILKKQPVTSTMSSSYHGPSRPPLVKGPAAGSYTKAIQLSKTASILDVPTVKVDLTQKGKYSPRPAPPKPSHRSQLSLVDMERVYAEPHSIPPLTSSTSEPIEPYAVMFQDCSQQDNLKGIQLDTDYVEIQRQVSSASHYDQPRKRTTTAPTPHSDTSQHESDDSNNIYANEGLGPDTQKQQIAAYMPLNFSSDRKSSETPRDSEYTGLVMHKRTAKEAADEETLYSVPSSNIRSHNISHRQDISSDAGGYVSLSPTRVEDNVYQDLNSSTRVSSVRQS